MRFTRTILRILDCRDDLNSCVTQGSNLPCTTDKSCVKEATFRHKCDERCDHMATSRVHFSARPGLRHHSDPVSKWRTVRTALLHQRPHLESSRCAQVWQARAVLDEEQRRIARRPGPQSQPSPRPGWRARASKVHARARLRREGTASGGG